MQDHSLEMTPHQLEQLLDLPKLLEVSSSKHLASERKGFAFWVELIASGLPSAGFLCHKKIFAFFFNFQVNNVGFYSLWYLKTFRFIYLCDFKGNLGE